MPLVGPETLVLEREVGGRETGQRVARVNMAGLMLLVGLETLVLECEVGEQLEQGNARDEA